MRRIDITGDKFDFVECSEGNIFFDFFSEETKFEVKVWGITLMHELGIERNDIYIAAMSNIVFEKVAYVFIDYGIYANEQGTHFVENIDGSTNMKLELGKKQGLSDYTEYMLGGIYGKNIGYGEMTIYCRGKVSLIYDETAAIDAKEFCINSQNYRL